MEKSVAKAYEIVTNRIIEIIETTNQLPWRKPWKRRWGRSAANSIGANYVSKHQYRGINSLMTALMMEMNDYRFNYWLTYKQAQELGGNVKKGEKGIPCVFFKMIDKKSESDDADEDKKKIFYAQYSTIFNVDQCEGFEVKVDAVEPFIGDGAAVSAILRAEEMIASFHDTPVIIHTGENKAYYSPNLDRICMPELSDFHSAEGYYSTLFHELVHSTGHQKRLNRSTLTDSKGFASHEYSKEELIAELGACFLNADAGIFAEVETNAAAYLASWLKVLKADPTMLVQAANAAQRAVDQLYGETKPQEKAA